MPTGFQSFNDWGTVQIDENYAAICVRNAPTITVSGFPNKTIFDVAGVSPMVFLGDTSGVGVVVLSRVSVGANVWRFTLMAASTVNVRIFIYDRAPPGYSGNSGLQVFNEVGELTYDSGYPVLMLAAVYQTNGSGATSIGLPADGRTYAAVLSYSRMRVEKRPVTHSPWNIYQDAIWVSGGSLYVAEIQTGSIGGETAGANRTPNTNAAPQILLADVTYL